MAAAGQESRPFEMAMLGLCLIQTGVVVLRLKTCRKYYKGDAAVNKGRDPIPEKRKGLGSADRPAQMVFGPVAMVSAVAIDVPFLVLEAKYFQVSSDRSRSIRLAERGRHANCVLTWVGIFISNVPSFFQIAGTSRASEGTDSVAVFALMFSLINIFIAIIMSIPYFKVAINRFLLGRIAETDAEVLENLYIRHGYKTIIMLLAVFQISAVFAGWAWLGHSVVNDENFHLIWINGEGFTGARGEASFSAFVAFTVIFCLVLTGFTIYQLRSVWYILANNMEGSWPSKEGKESKAVFQEGRTAPKRLTKWSLISSLTSCLPLLILMSMYSNAMSETSVSPSSIDAYHKCSASGIDLGDFTSCVCIDRKGSTENCFAVGILGVDIVSMGPSGVCTFAMAMMVVQLAIGVSMGWLYVFFSPSFVEYVLQHSPTF